MSHRIGWIERLDNALEKVERFVAASLFTALIALICFNIFARNILHLASHRLLEMAPTIVLWLALVGATLGLKQGRHIKIELLLRFFSDPARRQAIALTSLFGLVVCAVLAWAAVAFVRNEIALFGARGWPAGCFALFFALAAFRFALRLLGVWGKPEGPPS